MTDLQSIAERVAVLATLADKVKATLSEARQEQAKLLLELGASQVRVTLNDGTKIATVSLVDGRASARVADEPDFIAWVSANHPEHIEQVPATVRVNPAYRDQLLSDACGTGQAVDLETGQLVAGIGVTVGQPYVVAKKDAKAIERAWRDGRINPLDYVELPQIEARDADPA